MAACQCAGIDLVRLYMSLGNRLHLERISDDHPRHERRKNPRYRHAITGSLDDHFIGRSQPFPEPFQRRPGHVDPVRMLQYPRLPNHHLPEGPVNIHTNYASHKRLLSAKMTGAAGDTTTTDPRSQRNRVSRRGGQLLTRARSSWYTSACPHFRAPGASVPDGRTIYRDGESR